jgi:hypothetical protein
MTISSDESVDNSSYNKGKDQKKSKKIRTVSKEKKKKGKYS